MLCDECKQDHALGFGSWKGRYCVTLNRQLREESALPENVAKRALVTPKGPCTCKSIREIGPCHAPFQVNE